MGQSFGCSVFVYIFTTVNVLRGYPQLEIRRTTGHKTSEAFLSIRGTLTNKTGEYNHKEQSYFVLRSICYIFAGV